MILVWFLMSNVANHGSFTDDGWGGGRVRAAFFFVAQLKILKKECFQSDSSGPQMPGWGCRPPSVAHLFSPQSFYPMCEGRHKHTSKQTPANTPTQPLQMCRIIRSFLVVRFLFNCVGVFMFIRTTRIHLSGPLFQRETKARFIPSNYWFFFF